MELCGNGVTIKWSNERREFVVRKHGAEVGSAFRLPAARQIADQHTGSVQCLQRERWE